MESSEILSLILTDGALDGNIGETQLGRKPSAYVRDRDERQSCAVTKPEQNRGFMADS